VRRPDDFQFRDEQRSPLPWDDVVEFGTRRPPGYLIWLAGAAVIAVGAAALMSRPAGPPTPRPTPAGTASTVATPTSGTTSANLPLGKAAVLDLAVAGESTWVLQADGLTGYPVDGRHIFTRIGAVDFSRCVRPARA